MDEHWDDLVNCLACPFCGATSSHTFLKKEWGTTIKCGCCRSHGPFMKSRADAIRAWNKRTNDPNVTLRLNEFHAANHRRMHEDFAPAHTLTELVVCVQEELGELAAATLGATGKKKRKSHLTYDHVLDAVADVMTYLSLVASSVGCMDLERLLGETFNMVSERADSKIKVRVNDE